MTVFLNFNLSDGVTKSDYVTRQDQLILDTQLRLEQLKTEARDPDFDTSSVEKGTQRQRARTPKLPSFNENRDDLDAYLKRYERYATSQQWRQEDWAINLSALLSGKALEVYNRLSTDEADDYKVLKSALLKRFQLTADGFRLKLRTARPETGESGHQFAARLANYLARWIDLAEAETTYDGLTDLLLREQFAAGCSRELALFLKERQPKNIDTMATIAEQYLEARGGMFGNPFISRNPPNQKSFSQPRKDGVSNIASPTTSQRPNRSLVTCYICHKQGHVAKDCRLATLGSSTPRRCYICQKVGHLAKNCYQNKNPVASMLREGEGYNTDTLSQLPSLSESKNCSSHCQGCACVHKNSPEKPETVACMVVSKVSSFGACCFGNDQNHVTLKCGHSLPIMSAACSDNITKKMPVTSGRVGQHSVSVLRDSGCSGVVIRRDLVSDDQLTGDVKTCILIDGTARQVPVAVVLVSTPYFTGQTEVLCMNKPVYDLILGNIPGVRAPDNPDESWSLTPQKACAVQTRSQAKSQDTKPFHSLNVPKPMDDIVTAEGLKKAQLEDPTLRRSRELAETQSEKVSRSQATSRFLYRNGILYRQFHAPNVEFGNIFKQVVVPRTYRTHVMRMAHETILGGHQGPKKTIDRVLTNFFWPGITADITRYCRSCDVCQRTVPKGRVTKVPLGSMPLIEVPFDRIAVDIVGPIHPMTESRNRYILTIIDYATRYPEAIPLPSIEAERVAEALVGVFTRVGVPKQMLTDQGSQFTSEVMKQVSKLLSVHQLTTTPYHPMCNGLVERFNGTLKQMLRRMCAERPRDWDRYINPLLFAVREAPQESLGFSPFEMLYGRQVRGPMTILRELWTGKVDTAETKTTYQYILDLRKGWRIPVKRPI